MKMSQSFSLTSIQSVCCATFRPVRQHPVAYLFDFMPLVWPKQSVFPISGFWDFSYEILNFGLAHIPKNRDFWLSQSDFERWKTGFQKLIYKYKIIIFCCKLFSVTWGIANISWYSNTNCTPIYSIIFGIVQVNSKWKWEVVLWQIQLPKVQGKCTKK